MPATAVNGKSKSALVREYLAINPQATNTEILHALWDKYKVEVSHPHVSTLRHEYLESVSNATKVNMKNGTGWQKKIIWSILDEDENIRPRDIGKLAMKRHNVEIPTSALSRQRFTWFQSKGKKVPQLKHAATRRSDHTKYEQEQVAQEVKEAMQETREGSPPPPGTNLTESMAESQEASNRRTIPVDPMPTITTEQLCHFADMVSTIGGVKAAWHALKIIEQIKVVSL